MTYIKSAEAFLIFSTYEENHTVFEELFMFFNNPTYEEAYTGGDTSVHATCEAFAKEEK